MPAPAKTFNKVGFSPEQAAILRTLRTAASPAPTVKQLVTAGFTARQAKLLLELRTAMTTNQAAGILPAFTAGQTPVAKRLIREGKFTRDQVSVLLVA